MLPWMACAAVGVVPQRKTPGESIPASLSQNSAVVCNTATRAKPVQITNSGYHRQHSLSRIQKNSFPQAYFFGGVPQNSACRKSPVDFPAKLRKISKLVAQVPKFCDSDGKENPDGFLSHDLSLRILWPKRFFDSLTLPGGRGERGNHVEKRENFWKNLDGRRESV